MVPLHLLKYTDPQANSQDEAILSSETMRKGFSNCQKCGFFNPYRDFVETGSNEQQWNWLLDDSQASLLETSLVPTPGNHESQKNAFMDHFDVKPVSTLDTTKSAFTIRRITAMPTSSCLIIMRIPVNTLILPPLKFSG